MTPRLPTEELSSQPPALHARGSEPAPPNGRVNAYSARLQTALWLSVAR
jgi:hypothetical protein